MNNIKKHWEEFKDIKGKGLLGLDYHGTYNDIELQHLEMKTITKYVKQDSTVMEIGCGKGYLGLYLALNNECDYFGIDYCEKMIKSAKENKKKVESRIGTHVEFCRADILKNNFSSEDKTSGYDFVVTERCLINLKSWEEQKKAINNIYQLLKPNGIYLMLESNTNSLNRLNELRSKFNLDPIKIVWHNKFFDEDKLFEFIKDKFELVTIDKFCSTYFLLTRVLNTNIKNNCKEKQFAAYLDNYGDYGYQKLYVLKRK